MLGRQAGLARLRRAIASVARMYALYLVGAFFLQRFVIFPGTRLDARPPDPQATKVRLQDRDGVAEGFYSPARAGADRGRALLFVHGNAELAGPASRWLAGARAAGLSTLALEYPGYGGAEGAPSRDSLGAAVRAAFHWLVDVGGYAPEDVILMGRSLGGAVVCDLAAVERRSPLVLVSTFTRLSALARPFLLPDFALRDRFDCAASLPGHAAAVLVVHGADDEVVPVAHAHRLHGLAPQGGLEVLGCGHNDCAFDDRLWRRIAGLGEVRGLRPLRGRGGRSRRRARAARR